MAIETQHSNPKRDISDKTPGEAVHDSVMGTDKEMGDDHPGAPAAWVFATYPITLILFGLIIALVYMFSSSSDNNDSSPTGTNTPAAESTATGTASSRP